MTDHKRQFQIFLPGLLKVLAESLYSTNQVAVRELIQNAHDSCIRRQMERHESDYYPRIHVTSIPDRGVLVVEDNGSGLTSDEINDYLSTIGRSYTREFGEKLSILSPDDSARLVGQFGLGFLSAFLIASEVILTTKSVREESTTLRWRSAGDIHYELTPAPDIPVGTRVELVIKPTASFLLHENQLVEVIRQYADFLPTPIYVGDRHFPVNATKPPWQAYDSQAALLDVLEQHFKTSSPLCIIPLHDEIIDLGHDTLTIPLDGFLFVPPSSVASVREYGDVRVYIKGMFITDNQHDLLPAWARFVRGIVDSPHLQPTASREDIQKDDAFLTVRQAIENQLISGLHRIAQEDPARWRRIVQGHSDVIIGWAVQDSRFFQQVADLVTFRTSRGLLSLPAYLDKTGSTIYFTREPLGSLQQRVLVEADGLPVVDASWFAVEPFLRKYLETHPQVRLVNLEDQPGQLIQSVPVDTLASLVSAYGSIGIRARAANFNPVAIPAIITYPKDAEFILETRSALDDNELPGSIGSLVGAFVNQLDITDDDLRGVLHLNAGNTLIQELIMLPPDRRRNAALMLIYQIARLFAGRLLDADKTQDLFRETEKSLRTLLRKEDD